MIEKDLQPRLRYLSEKLINIAINLAFAMNAGLMTALSKLPDGNQLRLKIYKLTTMTDIAEQRRILNTTSASYLMLLILWILQCIVNYFGICGAGGLVTMITNMGITGLICVALVIIMILGSRMHLRAIGYFGASLMLLSNIMHVCLLGFFMTEYYADWMYNDVSTTTMIITLYNTFVYLIAIMGVTLLVFGMKISWPMRLLTIGYYLMGFLLGCLIPIIFSLFHAEYPTWYFLTCNIIYTLYAVGPLLVFYCIWISGQRNRLLATAN